ncbi:hypothetical protein PACTADRAFT_48166 [Pachysolen tannophilus NRRL Y-2460]|uniref:Uncharacterized protein n=1 Tax=Pachysolen tannophilus NRRL Y-2460 TaxID=669874 RepID=A0A1E4U324_PACTA|nr:hypothetical protein PACTADRAFT_48166 [Pachysolen tannophilus NRRL Y-2460]
MPILTLTSNKKSNLREEYFILPDSRLYYKELEFPKLIIPKSRKEFFKKINKSGNPPLSIDEIYNNIEPILKKFKCLATNIYEFDSFISKHSKSSQLYRSLKPHYEKVAENDLKRRRAELSRQKQIKIQNMLQHRKRSSRLEEKQKKRQEDEEIRLKEEEIMRQEAASIRAAKRMKLKENEYLSRENSLGAISREERYKRKQVDYEPEEQGITESETAGNTHVADSATADSAAADISTADLAAATEVQKSSSSTVEAEEPGANDSAIANEITNETANPVVDTVVNAVANPVEIPHTATPPPPVENQEPVIPPVQEETENKQETTQPSLPQLNTTESTTD